MTLRKKLELLNEMVVDDLIAEYRTKDVHPTTRSNAISILKNNSVIEEKPAEESAHSKIKELIKDGK